MDWSSVENADYFMDLETSTRNKKRHNRGVKVRFVPNSDRYDEEYVLFLESLEEFREQNLEGEEDNDDDPSYIDFLGNLKEHENAYACDVHEKDDDFVSVKRKTLRFHDGACHRKKKKLGDDGRSNPTTFSAPDNGSRDMYQKSSGLNNSNNALNKLSDVVKGKIPISSRGDCLREHRNLHVDDKRRSTRSSFGEQMSGEGDAKYKEFLDNLYGIDGPVCYEYGDNKRILYGSSDQQTSEVEIEPLQAHIRSPASTQRSPRKTPKMSPHASTLEPGASRSRPITPPSTKQITRQRTNTTNYNSCSTSTFKNKKNPRKGFSQFWKKLHESLRKPYSQKEFDETMERVSVRKPMLLYRESRSGGSWRPGKLGKSWLQKFPGLHEEIKNIESDHYKVLNLLRMFEIYLQKMCAGVPEPWLDDFTKTIMPGSE